MKTATVKNVLDALTACGLVTQTIGLGSGPNGRLVLSPVAEALIEDPNSKALEFMQVPGLAVEEQNTK